MAIEDTTYLSADSILAWERETSRGVAPSTASPWREFGRVLTWPSLGPTNSIFADPVAGSGQEAHEIGFEGIGYGDTIEFQVRDPLVLGYVFSKETARAQIGATGFYRHTLAPTDLGRLDSMSIGQRDRRLDGSGVSDDIIYLESVMARLGLRGEAINADGSGGRLMAAARMLPHDHTLTGADAVTVTLGSAAPYRFSHGRMELEGQQIFRVRNFELTIDRGADHAYFWQDVDADKPVEAVPLGVSYNLRATLEADGDVFTGAGNRTLENLVRDRVKFAGKWRFARTVDEDEFDFTFTDMVLEDARKVRSSRDKVVLTAPITIRKTEMNYVDQTDAAHFST